MCDCEWDGTKFCFIDSDDEPHGTRPGVTQVHAEHTYVYVAEYGRRRGCGCH